MYCVDLCNLCQTVTTAHNSPDIIVLCISSDAPLYVQLPSVTPDNDDGIYGIGKIPGCSRGIGMLPVVWGMEGGTIDNIDICKNIIFKFLVQTSS